MKDTTILQLNKDLFDKILSFGIDIRDCVLEPVKKHKITETEYLISTEANKKALDIAINDVKNNKNLVKVNIEDL